MRDPGPIARWMPGLARLRSPAPGDLRADLVAGLAVTSLLIPHGMAYAELAGVPAVTGLYTTVLALVAYAVFGPSRLLMLGPDSSLAPLIAAAIVLVGADGDPGQAVATAGMLALLTGAVCLAAGVARLGTLAELLSRPVRVGYLNGLAIVMIVSQLPKLLGFPIDGTSTLEIVVGLACLAVIVAIHLRSARAPGVLVAVAGATTAVALFDLDIATIGDVPSGFPRPDWPGIDAGDVVLLLGSAVGIALLTLSDTTALSRGFASRHGRPVDPNQPSGLHDDRRRGRRGILWPRQYRRRSGRRADPYVRPLHHQPGPHHRNAPSARLVGRPDAHPGRRRPALRAVHGGCSSVGP